MTKRKTRKASWLLTVASAYSVLPGCSDDPASSKPDAKMESRDGGLGARAPAEAGDVVAEAGSATDEVADDNAGDIDIGVLIGVIIFPPGGGDLPDDIDAGDVSAPAADDASADAETPTTIGMMALPPDATVTHEGSAVGLPVVPPKTR